MTFLKILLELMMILMFLTGAAVLSNIMDGLQMPWETYVKIFVEIRWVWRHQEPPQRLMTFLEFLLELMMILLFPTGAAVLDNVLHCLHMPWGSYIKNFVEIQWIWRHQEPPQRSMTFLEFLLELMIILMFLTGAAVLDDIFHGLHMPWGSYV